MRRAIAETAGPGIEADIWKIEGVDERVGLRDARRAGAAGTGARASPASSSVAAPTTRRSTTGCAGGARARASSASRSGARSGGTRSRASSAATCAREDAAPADRRQLPPLHQGVRGERAPGARRVAAESSNQPAPGRTSGRNVSLIAPGPALGWAHAPAQIARVVAGGRRGTRRRSRRPPAGRRGTTSARTAPGSATGRAVPRRRRRHDQGAPARPHRDRALHRHRHARVGQARHAVAVLRPPAASSANRRLVEGRDVDLPHRPGRRATATEGCSRMSTARRTTCS